MKFSWVDLLCVVCKDVGDCPLRNILKKKKKEKPIQFISKK